MRTARSRGKPSLTSVTIKTAAIADAHRRSVRVCPPLGSGDDTVGKPSS